MIHFFLYQLWGPISNSCEFGRGSQVHLGHFPRLLYSEHSRVPVHETGDPVTCRLPTATGPPPNLWFKFLSVKPEAERLRAPLSSAISGFSSGHFRPSHLPDSAPHREVPTVLGDTPSFWALSLVLALVTFCPDKNYIPTTDLTSGLQIK